MKNFLKNDLALKIVSLLIAIGLWFYVVQVQSPEIERTISDVPVVFTQKEALEAKGLSLLKDKEHTIDVKVRGRRKTVVEVNNTNITVIADVSQINSAGVHPVATNVVLPIGGIEIVKKIPATIDVEVDELMTKELEVSHNLTGTPKADYVTGDVSIEPKSVTVKGPKTVVEGISGLRVDIDVADKDSDVTAVSALKVLGTNEKEINSPYISLSSGTVQVSCQILKTKTVGLYPNLTGDLLNSDQAYEVDPASVKTIRVAGPAEVLDRLDAVKTQPISSLEDNAVQVGLKLPTGVHSLDGDKFNLRFVTKTKSVKETTVASVDVQGLSADMAAELPAEPIDVTLIGSADALAAVGALKASVDVTGLTAGKHTIALQLAYVENVWADRTYYIDVTIKQND